MIIDISAEYFDLSVRKELFLHKKTEISKFASANQFISVVRIFSYITDITPANIIRNAKFNAENIAMYLPV